MKAATVLIIESQAYVRMALVEVLEDAGYQVCEAANGRQGLERIRAQRVDLVIVNLGMSEMDGLELILEVTCAFFDVKVLIMNGHPGEKFQSRRLVTSHQTLTKSLDLNTFMHAVQKELQHELAH